MRDPALCKANKLSGTLCVQLGVSRYLEGYITTLECEDVVLTGVKALFRSIDALLQVSWPHLRLVRMVDVTTWPDLTN